MTRRRKEPDARQIIRFVAEQESLALTCDEFPGTSEERLRQILRDFLTETHAGGRRVRPGLPAAEKTDGKSPARVEVFTDGAARGNPGPAGAGWVIREPAGCVLTEGHAFLGRRTNNEAEYEAVIRALKVVADLGARDVALRSDSELLVRQINGQYRIREPRLEGLHRAARDVIQGFRRFEARHIPREQNGDADRQANRAIDEAGTA
ncbi:MAG: ribonuclease HI family protein [Deltaproteobacteria bacterium]|nr:ribonuclease HI family protein [Deltaproteobacteria bacterium]